MAFERGSLGGEVLEQKRGFLLAIKREAPRVSKP